MPALYQQSAAGDQNAASGSEARYGFSSDPGPAWYAQRPYRSTPGAVDTPANPTVSPLLGEAQHRRSLYGDTAVRDRRFYAARPLWFRPPSLGRNTCEGTAGATVTITNTAGPDQFSTVVQSGSGTVTFGNAHAHNDVSAIRLLTTAGVAGQARVTWNLSTQDTQRFGRCYIWLDVLPVSAAARVMSFTNGPSLRIDATGHLAVFTSGGTLLATMTPAIPVSQWVRVEFEYTALSGTGGNYAARMFSGVNLETSTPDAGASLSGSNASLFISGPGNMNFGLSVDLTEAGGYIAFYDDIGVSPDATPGPAPPGADEPLGFAAGTAFLRVIAAAYWDRREVPQQRVCVSDPSLLAVTDADPLTLNPPQSDASDAWRAAIVPAFYDRREVPQQRTYYDPSLLAAAELENELLGGAETFKHYGVAATNAARWWMPQQPARLADPLLIATALNENVTGSLFDPLLAAAYQDRRLAPQQRAYVSDPSLLATALNENVTGGFDPAQIAAYWDRREVPQQRLYISDPSFYPTTAPTDPLSIAWGDAGPYWQLYNSAATHADRREVPQQRAYVSDPLLLATALLENELLGAADTARHYLAAAYGDRREVPQQRVGVLDPSFYLVLTDPLTLAWGAGGNYWHLYNRAADVTDRREYPAQRACISDPLLLATALLENELLGGAETFRRYGTAATHADRREVPQQRPFYAVPGQPLDPTVAAWNDLARRYLTAVTHRDRRLYPQQRIYWPPPPPPPPLVPATGTATATDPREGVSTIRDLREGTMSAARDPREGKAIVSDPREGSFTVRDPREGSGSVR
jgi:hypothetical protein